MTHTRIFLTLLFLIPATFLARATDYFVHPVAGNDANSGLSTAQAIRSLERASQLVLSPGDRLLLAAGQRHTGSLSLVGLQGHPNRPIAITTVAWPGDDTNQPALIDAKGHAQALLIRDCQYVHIDSLRIQANGSVQKKPGSEMRCGILVTATANGRTEGIVLANIRIQDIFHENPGYKRPSKEVTTANGSEPYGWGIRLMSTDETSKIENIRIEACHIENIEHTGIKLTGARGRHNISRVWLYANHITHTGGPGIQLSNVKFVHVAANEITYSGSADDSRKWGRGSGLWTWSASNVLIEKNRFMYANGPGDSAGAHIDYNCDNVVLQYNFSAHNAGGFCEILGNTYNCAYRYNISVNDGYRVKGKNGAFQEGKLFWLSGYQGNAKERKGPINTYFYNNTIYVSQDIETKFAIDGRSDGVLIANNIFCIEGRSLTVLGDQNKPDTPLEGGLNRVFFHNNLYLKPGNWPSDLPIQDQSPLFGDPEFTSKGGLLPADYLPRNIQLVKGKGIKVPYLPSDAIGLMQGLRIPEDIEGKMTDDIPSLGALKMD